MEFGSTFAGQGLCLTLEFLEERTIGPELGADSIAAGKMAVWWPLAPY